MCLLAWCKRNSVLFTCENFFGVRLSGRRAAGAGASNKLIRTAARYAKHKLAGVGYRGKAAPPKSRRGGQNDYQMRMIRDPESIEDVNGSQQTVETAPNGLDCQLLRDLATIVAHGKAIETASVMLQRVN